MTGWTSSSAAEDMISVGKPFGKDQWEDQEGDGRVELHNGVMRSRN